MCGRYAASRNPDDLVEEFEVERVVAAAPLEPDYNVAPTKDVYAVLTRIPRHPDAQPDANPDSSAEKADTADTADSADGPVRPVRQLRVLRWGLVPSWAKDPSIGSRLINARMETVADKPAFRRAFARRRCLLPADGYYEWYAGDAGADNPRASRARSGRPAKQPFFIRPSDGGVLAMAGLYEFWRDPAADPDDPAAWLTTCTVITTQAVDAVGRIHDRMPMLVEPDRFTQWLDPTVADTELVRGLLVPAAPGRLDAYPVSTAVNNVRNNGPELIEPVPAAGQPVPAEGGALF
jgi:putative SOS response-associated peptidase YedK